MAVIRRTKKSQVSPGKGTKSTASAPATKGKGGRAVARKSESPAPKKAVRGRARVTTVAKPTSAAAKKTRERQVDEVTGFGVGTDSDVMIKEAMKGGNTRPEVIGRIKDKLPKKTETGSDKPVANVFASVLKKKLDQGWYIESSWVLRPPTPQSKAKLTRERNAAAKKSDENVTSISKNAGSKKTAASGRKRVTPRKKAA